MLKKRLVLSLNLRSRYLVNSRRFELNNVAEIHVMKHYLNFNAVDEVVIVNVANDTTSDFCKCIEEITDECFIPITAGGGVKNLEDAKQIFSSGADKLLVNEIFYTNLKELENLKDTYGAQALVLSLDFKKIDGEYIGFYCHAQKNSGLSCTELIEKANEFGVGEIYVRSIENDGSGAGYDKELLSLVCSLTNIPIVAAGGVGTFKHFSEGIDAGADAVSVGNLFHFVGERLVGAKDIINKGLDAELFPSAWNH